MTFRKPTAISVFGLSIYGYLILSDGVSTERYFKAYISHRADAECVSWALWVAKIIWLIYDFNTSSMVSKDFVPELLTKGVNYSHMFEDMYLFGFCVFRGFLQNTWLC